jgi:hypothetical protein
MKDFKYLGQTLTDKNSIQGSRFKSGYICYHPLQNLLSFGFLSKNIKIKIYRTTILPVFVWV